MYWTEEEALTKLCCGGVGCGEMRSEGAMLKRFCITYRCMAWRQATFFKNTKTGEVPIKPGLHEAGTAAECGYCGLAGVPPIFEGEDLDG